MLSRPATTFSISLASGLGLFLAAQGLVRGVVASPTFLVTDLEARWSPQVKLPPERYRLNPPSSIFQINLESVARALEKRHPTARVDKVTRILPNRIVAFLRPSYVVAQLKSDHSYYLLSEEGNILTQPQGSPWPHAPIFFLEELRGPFPVGRRLAHPSFEAACELLAEIHRRGGISGRRVSSIRARGSILILLLDSGLEVRLKGNRLTQGLEQLVELAAQKPEILHQASYIDLRFEDPTLSIEAGSPRKQATQGKR